MRERSIPSPPKRHPRIVWSGAILIVVGLSLTTVLGEWFATYDASVANPICYAGASVATIETYLGRMVVGIGLVVAGFIVALKGARGELRRAMIIWV